MTAHPAQRRPDAAKVLNALAQPLLTVDAQGLVIDVNVAAETFFDMGRGMLVRSRLTDLIPSDSPVLALVADALSNRATVNGYKIDISTPRTGNRNAVDVFIAPLPQTDDAVAIMLQERAIAEKIDRQLTHRSAARSITALGLMLAHEIKNPLSGIRGAAQLLEASVSDEDRALTRLICEETDRIVKLVDRMQSFADSTPSQWESLNIHAVLDHVKRLAQAGFARHIRFVEMYDPSLPHVHGSRDQLIQVFLNLVKNAAEAIGRDSIEGEITLTTAYRPGVRLRTAPSADPVALPLEICVRDNGPGIAPEILGNLFDPFVTTKPQGSGLGLALVAKLVGDHGGIIECESHPRRTMFRVLMPLSRRAPRRGEGLGVGAKELTGMPSGHILVADDDAGIRTVLNQALTRAGYEVRATGTVAGLWRWVAAGEGDLVITDVVMPDDNAFDLLPRIKRMRPDLPIIVMSAQNTFITAIKASERGAYEYLPKPFDLRELVAIVGRALAEPKRRREAAETAAPAEVMPIVGRSPAMQDIFRVLARLMQTDLTVMISGESGTGKELVARALHDYGKRKGGPVRRHQHGRHPARPHRERTLRPREGRLHRRRRPLCRTV